MGGVWCYVDCLSWNGPLPTEPVSLNPVGFDPVSGRNGQINVKWKPQCLAKGYQFQLSNDIDFTALIADIGNVWGGPFYIPPDLDVPTLIIPAGGGRIVDSAGTVVENSGATTQITPTTGESKLKMWLRAITSKVPGHGERVSE